jgi:hypothetical protein
MACIAKRRGRYVIDFYDNQGKRQRMTLKKGTTKKKAKEKLRRFPPLPRWLKIGLNTKNRI